MGLIIQKLYEYERLKEVLLSEDQRIIFEGLERPRLMMNVSEQDPKKMMFYFDIDQTLESERPSVDEIAESLLNIRRKNGPIDERLLKMYEKSIYIDASP